MRPEHRRGGLASALIAELKQRLAARGAPRINLLVMPENIDGPALLAATGLPVVLRRPVHQDGVDLNHVTGKHDTSWS